MKRTSMNQLLFLCTLLSLAICTNGTAEETKTDQFRVGVIVPLSGPIAEYGHAFKNGITLAIEDQQEGVSDLKLLFEDNEYDPKKTISAFQSLKDLKQIDVVYNFGGPTSDALAPLADKYKIPLFISPPDPTMVYGNKFVMRFENTEQDFGTMLNDYLSKTGIKRIGIVQTENPYLNCMIRGLKKSLKPGQSIDIIDSYTFTDQDFRSTITKIKYKHYDAIGVYLLSGQVAQFYRQLASQKIEIPTFGTDFFESKTEINSAGPAINGAVFINHGVSELFRQRYIEKFGNDYQLSWAGFGYDFISLIGALFGNSSNSSLNPEEKMKLIENTTKRSGQLGNFQFKLSDKGDRYFEFPILLRRINSGTIETIGDHGY